MKSKETNRLHIQRLTGSLFSSFLQTNYTGLANLNNTVDIQELAGAKTPSSTLNGANNKGIFRNQAKAVDAACGSRADLRKKALARVSAIHKAGRVARAKK